MIAFTVAQLQPCLTVGFILAYAQQVLVEKFNVSVSCDTFCPLQRPSLATPT